ncbi:MAG: hypothetical protein H6739_28605 [Alphaproteobacteria bacterium]|nr:hypothetical protein [Alphaproteobacteria bacterium]
MPPVSLTAPFVQALLVLPFFVMGLSHIVQPAMWREYFLGLHAQGPPGLVTRTFSLELWSALLIVTFHQVWGGPAVVLTLYGHALMTKIILSMLAPRLGLRSLALAGKGDNGFRAGGVMLMALGALDLWVLIRAA